MLGSSSRFYKFEYFTHLRFVALTWTHSHTHTLRAERKHGMRRKFKISKTCQKHSTKKSSSGKGMNRRKNPTEKFLVDGMFSFSFFFLCGSLLSVHTRWRGDKVSLGCNWNILHSVDRTRASITIFTIFSPRRSVSTQPSWSMRVFRSSIRFEWQNWTETLRGVCLF